MPVPNAMCRFGLRCKIEPLRMRIGRGIHVGGRQHRHDPLALLHDDAAEIDVAAHIARLGELHRGEETQEFLDREIDAAPVLLEPVAQIRVFQELVHGAADQVRGGLVAREQQQEHHGYDFVRG